jgi:hypothetical protein
MVTPARVMEERASPANNHAPLAGILAAHYAASRASVDDWLKRRDQYLMLLITVVTAISGVFLSNLKETNANSKEPNVALLYLISPFALVVLMAYISADLHIAFLCKWLKVEYTALLDKYVAAYGAISLGPWHWDNSVALAEFYAHGTGGRRYTFTAITFSLAHAAAPFLAIAVTVLPPLDLSVMSLGSIVLSCIALARAYRERKTIAGLTVITG